MQTILEDESMELYSDLHNNKVHKCKKCEIYETIWISNLKKHEEICTGKHKGKMKQCYLVIKILTYVIFDYITISFVCLKQCSQKFSIANLSFS